MKFFPSIVFFAGFLACGAVNTRLPSQLSATKPKTEGKVRTAEIPAGNILNAARQVRPQTGPEYSVEGGLHCSQVAGESPSNLTETSCDILVDGQLVKVEDSEAIVSALAEKVKPMSGSAYAFSL
jgi:hypothetical protein